jgi:hypothetical protein
MSRRSLGDHPKQILFDFVSRTAAKARVYANLDARLQAVVPYDIKITRSVGLLPPKVVETITAKGPTPVPITLPPLPPFFKINFKAAIINVTLASLVGTTALVGGSSSTQKICEQPLLQGGWAVETCRTFH